MYVCVLVFVYVCSTLDPVIHSQVREIRWMPAQGALVSRDLRDDFAQPLHSDIENNYYERHVNNCRIFDTTRTPRTDTDICILRPYTQDHNSYNRHYKPFTLNDFVIKFLNSNMCNQIWIAGKLK